MKRIFDIYNLWSKDAKKIKAISMQLITTDAKLPKMLLIDHNVV